jgi:hypothetical protein
VPSAWFPVAFLARACAIGSACLPFDLAAARWRRFNQRCPSCFSTSDVAPNFYPAAIGVWTLVMPCWAVVAAVRGAEPSVERSAADRRCAA